MVLAIASCSARQRVKYGERAYRFTLLECGHLAQNIVLLTSALGLGALPVGGFLDNEVNDYLGLDGADEAAQYLILLGQLPEP